MVWTGWAWRDLVQTPSAIVQVALDRMIEREAAQAEAVATARRRRG